LEGDGGHLAIEVLVCLEHGDPQKMGRIN